jgi:hypothetical protein
VNKWTGEIPSCQLCKKPSTDVFVDGKTSPLGQWAYMCVNCHKDHGLGFGLGRGQKYQRQNDGSFVKVEG